MALKGVTKDSNNSTAFLRLRNIFARRNTQKVKSTAAIMGLFISIATIMSSSPLTSYIGVVQAQTLAGTNFPPPIFYTIKGKVNQSFQWFDDTTIGVRNHDYNYFQSKI